ncbi:hypothetical protein ATK74_1682 [Propionicimonas paludicola]|uniref:Ketoreductase domain-containing protein n=1 Tax=Propionicimonas paludicola TaxID=185243 RepID=A0A2A9CSH0_9ACTN|nr:SDR family oxidoreductase [Propionicimonas paludicola]PFG17121.1 hypothetical protein ATK74_1682 [Propionicimonas paludicola]
MTTDDTWQGFPAQEQHPPGLTGEMTPEPDHGEQSYVGHGRLNGLLAMITGGDSGIGRAVAIAYAREGADVVIVHLPEEQPDAEATLSWIERAGRRGFSVVADLTSAQACRNAISAAVERLGGLDVLVNNAGFHYTRNDRGTIDGLEPELVDRVIQTNLTATLWLTQAALPHLGPGASIINTSSIQAYDPSGNMVDYAGTKAAINSITANLAQQLGPRGIRVNAVAPGPIWTPLQPATRSAEEVSRFGSNSPLGRAGQPAEVAPAYVYLASPLEASYVSGSIIGVTGGLPTF